MASLRSARRDANELLKETRGLNKKFGKRINSEEFAKVGRAQEELENAARGNQPDLIVGLTRKLEEAVSKAYLLHRKSPARQYIESLGSALLIAALLRLFVVEMFKIPSGSMVPTLLIGDHLFVSKFIYGIRVPFMNHMLVQWSEPKRGDVIVFNDPRTGDKDLIKRVAGLPGDEISLQSDTVYVNGVEQPREKVSDTYEYDDYPEGLDRWIHDDYNALYREKLGDKVHLTLERRGIPHKPQGPYHVPAGSVLVLGDNRDNSCDSRCAEGGYPEGWTVPFGNIKGKAFIIVFSVGKGGWWFCHGDGPLCMESGIRLERFFHVIH